MGPVSSGNSTSGLLVLNDILTCTVRPASCTEDAVRVCVAIAALYYICYLRTIVNYEGDQQICDKSKKVLPSGVVGKVGVYT